MPLIAIGRLLCPVDFSAVSELALRRAEALRETYEAELVTLFVSTSAIDVEGDGSTGRTEHEQLGAFVAAVVGGGNDVRHMVTRGEVVPDILQVAADVSADLIVMGTHGTSGVRRLLIGSVTERVLRRSVTPVMTVPPGAKAPAAWPLAFRTVVCAVDFSDASKRALDYAVSIATQAGGRLVVLHVLEWFAEEAQEPTRDNRAAFPTSEQDAVGELEALMHDARAGSLELLVGYGAPSAELLRVIEERDADLIVLGVQGRNVLDRALFGSTTRRVVRRSSCAVLTVRGLTASA
jgi:nucleotide-binding universal stress UspA family protein